MCKACEKTNVVCEGYPPRIVWGTRTADSRVSKSKLSPIPHIDTLEGTRDMMMTDGRNADLNKLLKPGAFVESGFFETIIPWFNVPVP